MKDGEIMTAKSTILITAIAAALIIGTGSTPAEAATTVGCH
jgi:hypothetical protein